MRLTLVGFFMRNRYFNIRGHMSNKQRVSVFILLMSIQIKKKSKLYKILDDQELADILLFSFLINELQKLMCLDKIIAQAVLGRLRHHINSVHSKIKLTYGHFLPIQKPIGLSRSIELKVTKTKRREIKLQVPICLNVGNLKKDKIFSLSYSYTLMRKMKPQKHLWVGQFEINQKANRNIWIYREKHNNTYLPLMTSDVQPLCSNDTLNLMIPISIMGRIAKNIKFYPLETDSKDNLMQEFSLTKNTFKEMYDSKKQCQIQSLYEWQQCNIIEARSDFQIAEMLKDYLGNKMKIESLKKSQVEEYYRVELVCVGQGVIESRVGMNKLLIYKEEQSIGVQLKKKGSYLNENSTIKLRVGDKLIIYIFRI